MSFRSAFVFAVFVIVLTSRPVDAQDRRPTYDAGEMTVRVYPVGQLVRNVPDFPYQPGLPTTDTKSATPTNLLGTASAGGGGGLGVGMGANLLPVYTSGLGGLGGSGVGGQRASRFNGLIEVIQTSIAPQTWNTMGGPATIVEHGNALIIRQTPDLHTQIKELIGALSQSSDTQSLLTVQAYLVSWGPGEETDAWQNKLREAQRDPSQAAAVFAELRKSAEKVGQITCFSGQTVHLASGQVRNVVTSVVPVVSAVTAAYQPVIAYLHIGTLLETTTTLDAGSGDAATIDVRCTVTEWNDAGDPIRVISEFGAGKTPASGAVSSFGGGAFGGGGTSVGVEGSGGRSEGTIDRINMDTRQLATTVRVSVRPENESPIPVLVGSLGPATPSTDQAAAAKGLTYLIVAVSRQ